MSNTINTMILGGEKGETMKAEQVLKKVKEYLQLNAEDNSHSDIQADSEHLLFWIENWETQNDSA